MKLKTTLFTVAGLLMTGAAFAQEGGAAGHSIDVVGMASALGLGLAATGGAFAQSKVAAAALEGISRNPAAAEKVFTPMIIGLALIESLVLYMFVIAFLKMH